MRLGLSAIIVCLTGIANAEVHTNNTAGISIDIPSVWKLEAKGEVMTGQSADDTVGLMFWVVDQADAKESLKLLDKQIEKVVTKASWQKPVERAVNGLKGFSVDGKGVVAGKKADLMVALLGPTPTNKGIIVFAAVEHAKAEPHKVELMNIFASLKPSK
jgi:hypothetical protein